MREFRITWYEYYKVRPAGALSITLNHWTGWLVCNRDGWHVRLDGITSAQHFTRAEVSALLSNRGMDCGLTFACVSKAA